MLCPIDGSEMEATGGVPTIWLCKTCTAVNKGKHIRKPEVYFKGDGVNTLEAL